MAIFKDKGINHSTQISNPQMKIATVNSVVSFLAKIERQLKNWGNGSYVISNSMKPVTNFRSNPPINMASCKNVDKFR